MNRLSPFTEEDLIAYHLQELPRWRAASLRRALEHDPELAAESEAIAQTLRAFRHAPTPAVNEVIFERNWDRVRSSLPVLTPGRRVVRRIWWFALGAATSAVAVAVLLLLVLPSRVSVRRVTTAGDQAQATPRVQQPLPVQSENTKQLLTELHAQESGPGKFNSRPGPLTTSPVEQSDPRLSTAAYLDSAERVLTQVNNTEGPLQPETRAQVHKLLLNNALYQHEAQQRGDLARASVLDDLGRVLVTLDAEPAQPVESDDAVRLQVNLGGVLFDLRVLHHNTQRRGE